MFRATLAVLRTLDKNDMRLLILGIGNLLWADEGFGVRCVEALHRHYEFPGDVLLMDGGTQGVYLLPYVEEAERLLVFDAVDYGLPPGELRVVRNDDVPRFMGAKKMSLHQTGFQEVLACASLQDRLPVEITLVGVQPEELADYGGSLRDSVKARIPQALEIALEQMRDWGIVPVPRSQPLPEGAGLNANSLDMGSYESGRPSAEAACRIGDDRFLPRD